MSWLNQSVILKWATITLTCFKFHHAVKCEDVPLVCNLPFHFAVYVLIFLGALWRDLALVALNPSHHHLIFRVGLICWIVRAKWGHDSFVPCDIVFTAKCAKLCAQANVMRDVCCVLCTYSVLRNEYCMFFTPYIAVIMMTLIFLIHILDPFHLLMLRSLSDGHAVVKCDSKSTRDKKRKKKKTKRQLHYSHSLFENFFLFFWNLEQL